MKLIDGWRAELNRLWSVKLTMFTALLAVADVILAQFQASLSPLVYAVLATLIIVTRIVQQTKPVEKG